ncbi:MAG: hypothetical protein KF693_06080 [Nitrospira sp.]|nr:hypothetical protein [Nitrospira sp.]
MPRQYIRPILITLIEVKFAMLREIQARPQFRGMDLSWGLSLAVALHDAADVDDLPPLNRELRSFILSESSFGKREARAILDKLLSDDSHLRKCCQTAWGLARTIDLLLPEALEAMPSSWDEGGVEFAVSRMVERLYESEFRRNVFVRVYNLDSEMLSCSFPGFDFDVVRLEHTDIALLVGETTSHSALHDVNTGTCFFKFVITEPSDDQEAFQTAWTKAYELLSVLRYLKYGVIDIDYGAIYYAPEWVTHLRRYGIAIWGQPRRDKQTEFYKLSKEALPEIANYLSAYSKLEHILKDPQPSSLRMANALAAHYYEGHYRKAENERDQKLIELVTAMEALFSPGKDGELRFRIAQRAALLLGKEACHREQLARFLRRLYDGRSQILHLGISAFNPPEALKQNRKDLTILTDSDLIQLGDLVRQAILRTLTLVWRQKNERDEMNSTLDKAALNESVRNEIFQLSDFEQALKELSAV